MKKIRMITLAASAEGTLEPGAIYDVPAQVSQEDAAALVKGGYALVVEEKQPAAVETAALAMTEEVEAAVPAEKPRKRK